LTSALPKFRRIGDSSALVRRVRRMPGEFELIARLVGGLRLSPRTIVGPGDDCAVLKTSRAPQLFTIDSVVEGVHFDPAWGTPETLGARALAVNLSDIAAMGGRPTACVVNLAVPPGLDGRFFDRLYAGLRAEARRARVDIVGGNITRARELAITIALLGDAGPALLRRDAARAGDEVFVTGTLGDAAVGWRILAGKLRAPASARRFLVDRFLLPKARLDAGRQLTSIRPAPAAIDISDGLLQDLGHICERSRVGARIDAAAIPVSRAYRAVYGEDLELALGGGEDYELVFCLRPGHSARELVRRLGVRVSRIGRIVRGRGVSVIGAARPGAGGFDQLRSRG
jgi:thiamine-monophosphate kinase